jgi:hypothetical protein
MHLPTRYLAGMCGWSHNHRWAMIQEQGFPSFGLPGCYRRTHRPQMDPYIHPKGCMRCISSAEHRTGSSHLVILVGRCPPHGPPPRERGRRTCGGRGVQTCRKLGHRRSVADRNHHHTALARAANRTSGPRHPPRHLPDRRARGAGSTRRGRRRAVSRWGRSRGSSVRGSSPSRCLALRCWCGSSWSNR